MGVRGREITMTAPPQQKLLILKKSQLFIEFPVICISNLKIVGSRKSIFIKFQLFNLTLYVPCIILQCVDKPTRCNTSYE